MPVISLGDRLPCPIGRLEVLKNNPGLRVLVRSVAPDVKIARASAGFSLARASKPRVLIGGMIDNQLGYDSDAATMSLAQEKLEILQGAVVGMNTSIVGDVVAVVF